MSGATSIDSTAAAMPLTRTPKATDLPDVSMLAGGNQVSPVKQPSSDATAALRAGSSSASGPTPGGEPAANMASKSQVNAAMRSACAVARRTTLFSSLLTKPDDEKLFEPVKSTWSSTMTILLCRMPNCCEPSTDDA